MGILDGLLSPLKGLFGIEEPEKPKTFVSEKSKTNQAVPIVVGHNYVKLEGIPVFKRISTDETRVGIVHALCVGPVIQSNDRTDMYVDDIISTDPRYRSLNVSPGSVETTTHIWRSVRAGTENSGPSGWQDYETWFDYPLATAFGKGVCHSMVMYRRDAEVFSSEPKIWYKVRKGSLRSLDGNPNMPDAWADNPYAFIKWYMRDTVVGMEQDESMFGASFDDAIDWLENNLVSQGAIQRKRFTLNGIIQTDKDFEEVLADLEQHSMCRINFINGKYEIAVKGRTTTPALTLDKDNIVGKIDVEHPDARDRATRVIVTWINPFKQWEEDEAVYPPYDDPLGEYAAALADDGYVENVIKYKNYLTDNYEEAYEFARVKWRESRESATVKLTAQAEASILIQYDVVAVTDERRGWTDKLFIVESKSEVVSDSGGEEYELELTEYNPTIYAWSGQGNYTPEPTYNYNPSLIEAIDSTTFVWDDNTRILSWDRPNTQQIITEYVVYVDGEQYRATATESVKIELPIGTYGVSVVPRGLITGLGEAAGLEITIATIGTPSIAHYAGNFSIRVVPYMAGDTTGIQYEVAIDDNTDIRGPTNDYLFENLSPNTEYTIYARATNGVDTSAWATALVTTTNDGTDIINLVGPTLADDIFNDVVTEIQGDLQTVVDGSLADYSTTTETQALIDTSIAEVNDSVDNDFRVDLLSGIIDIAEDFENKKSIATETEQREQDINTVTVSLGDNTAQIQNAFQAIADESSARATEINAVTVAINDEVSNRQAAILSVNQAIADETSARATAISGVSAAISDETSARQAAVTTLEQSIVDESSARATAITSLEASITGTGGAIDAAITSYNDVLVSPTGAIATSINAAFAASETEGGSIYAASELAQQAKTTADGNATALAALTSRVESEENATSAQLILNSEIDDDLGVLYSRAFLGVTSTTGGVTTVAGIVVDGATNGINFQGDVFSLSDTQGNGQLYWDDVSDTWKFSGFLEAAGGVFGGALQAATGTFSGDLDAAGGTFSGTVQAAEINAPKINLSGGWLITQSQAVPGPRTVINQGGYQVWIGEGVTNQANAYFYVDNNGNRYIKGDFLEGQLTEQQSATGTTTASVTHNSAGKPVQISVSVAEVGFITGDYQGVGVEITAQVKRGSTVLKTMTFGGAGQVYEPELDRTRIVISGADTVVDNSTTPGSRTYSITITAFNDSGTTKSCSIVTFENKVG